ncbi:MAG: hypothetical protein KAX37_09200 [Opitutaceae bacterium]|nr:hypothetical protein [Opitutaceae bacterium]
MKVSFTPTEFARVLELVHFGMHVVSAYQGGETAAAKRYQEIEGKLLSLAKSLDCADLVEESPEGRLIPSPKITKEERVEQVLSEHTNDTFWHELVARLSDRDYAADQAKRHLASSTPGLEAPPSLEEELKKIEDGYWKEFEKHDLNHVFVLRGGKG